MEVSFNFDVIFHLMNDRAILYRQHFTNDGIIFKQKNDLLLVQVNLETIFLTLWLFSCVERV